MVKCNCFEPVACWKLSCVFIDCMILFYFSTYLSYSHSFLPEGYTDTPPSLVWHLCVFKAHPSSTFHPILGVAPGWLRGLACPPSRTALSVVNFLFLLGMFSPQGIFNSSSFNVKIPLFLLGKRLPICNGKFLCRVRFLINALFARSPLPYFSGPVKPNQFAGFFFFNLFLRLYKNRIGFL